MEARHGEQIGTYRAERPFDKLRANGEPKAARPSFAGGAIRGALAADLPALDHQRRICDAERGVRIVRGARRRGVAYGERVGEMQVMLLDWTIESEDTLPLPARNLDAGV